MSGIRIWLVRVICLLGGALPLTNVVGPAHAEDAAVASEWISEHATKVRLVGGSVSDQQQKRHLVAGIEIALDTGWKTYWRNPGTSGVPPRFDWSASENVADATLLFPAPTRFVDREGDTIGYKSGVILPVEIVPKDANLPVKLKFALEYGVCKDVCVPVQPTLELTLAPAQSRQTVGTALNAALELIPRLPTVRHPNDPELKGVTINLQGNAPEILIDAAFAGDMAGADVFLEAPDGIWVPLAKPVGEARDGVLRFRVDLTDGADVADLKGRSIRVTLVSGQGQTDTSFKFD